MIRFFGSFDDGSSFKHMQFHLNIQNETDYSFRKVGLKSMMIVSL